MASFTVQEYRPLKKLRLCTVGPDVYPQDPKQKEDELTTMSVKHGYNNALAIQEEHGSARNANITRAMVGASFNAIMEKKTELSTFLDQKEDRRKRLPINTKDNFWLVLNNQKSKNALDAWMKELAGTRPLSQLAKKVPVINKKEEIFSTLCDFNVPMSRATWFIKMTNAYNTAVSETKPNKRMRFDPSIDWVGAICRFIREQLQRIAEYHQGSPTQTSFLTAGTTSAIDLDLTIKHWKYSTQLARYLFEEGLLDPQEFLNWLVDILEKMKSYDVTILKLILSQVLKYIHWFVKSQRLSRHLAHFCACKLAQYGGDYDPLLPQALVTTPGGNDGATPAPSTPAVSHNPVIALYGEYLQCPQHRQVILCLSSILQSITVRCPGSLVWHDFGEGKTSSVLSGSPLDLLTFGPSCLPMPPRADNQKIRSILGLSEQQIQLRGQAVEIRWSCDKGHKSAAGAVIRKTLNVLEALDRNNFSCVEANSSLDTLYNRIFGDKQHPVTVSSIKTHATSYDDAIIMLLCEWAISTQRAGDHRAIVVAKLLEKHQNNLLSEKFGDAEAIDEKESVGSEMLPPSGLPPYQKLLMHFLDKKAPALDENPTVENSAAFANLVLLFGELIRHDIFSHDAYICTLISRGDLAMTQPLHAATGGVRYGSGAGIDKMDSESVKPEIQEEMRMELESQHLDDFEDIFAFRDDGHHSPSQPGSIKSSTDQPLSAPTPTQAHTPVQAHTPGMARTPGAPNTPGAARTPGAPQTPSNTPGTAHTPGMAHTPGKAATPSSLSLTPGGMAHTPMVPHTPASIPPPSSSVATTQQLPRRPSNHIAYATHFPIPQDDMSTHECNQRLVVLYGVGKAREEARLIAKRVNKENVKLFAKKNSIDATSGVVGGKQKKKKDKEESVNFEALFTRFQKLPYYDQQVVTGACAAGVLEAIAAFVNGTSVYLPVVDNVSYLFDLMQSCLSISGLLEFIVHLLKELPEVEAQLHLKASSLANSYTTTLTLCSMAVLRRYHAYLILSHHLTVTVFESLCKIVKHVSNPSDSTSAERCILAYLYELYKCCYYIKSKFAESFGASWCLKIHATLYTTLMPSASNLLWEPGFLKSLIDNPKGRPDSQSVKQLNDSPASRYSFVCNAMLNICNCQSSDRLNELSLLCVELTACCTALSAEWLGVLKALCCSSNPSCGFIDVLTQVDVGDLSIHDSLAVFTAILIARHCFSLEDLVIHVALHSLLAACPTMASGGDQDAESGARLTCHILFRLFQTPQVSPGSSVDGGKSTLWVRASCDRHLLEAAHDSISVGAVVAVLKAGLMLGDSCSGERSSPSNHKGSPQDLISSMLCSLDDHDLDMMGMIGSSAKGRGGMERAGLSDYAQHTLREICSQEWVREKFLKDPEALFNPELLLDKMLSHAQAQQLVQMICYPGNIPSFPCEDEDDEEDTEEQRNISRILKNLDRWSMRVSWLELQLMFKQAAPSEMSMLLENISKATIDVFEEQTEKWTNQGYSSWQQADADSWADNDSVWLVAPLVARLPSNVQGRVLKLAGQVLETGSNFWSAKNAKDKERHLQKSTALLGHQPFLSLVLTCLQGQDEQREGLLKSLHDELEKFVNNAKEEQERGVSTDERLKSMVEEALLLRLSLVGGLFDTIQKNNGNVQDWTILLIQLVSHSVVDINNNSELFRVVEDMLSVLIHGTLVSDSSEKGEENRKTYTSLTRKLKRELGELQSESIDQIRTLLPLPKQHYMVITSERHTCQTEARGHRAIGFDTIDGKQGLQVTGRQRVSAWDILEGHKNPAPLSLAWFGAIRQERKVLKYEEHFRMLLLHTHSLMKPDSYFLEPPPLPPEELDPVPEKQETKLVEQHTERKQPEATVKRKKTKTRRASRSTSVTSVNTSYINPSNMPQMGFRQDMYGGALPPAQSSWAYRPSQPQHPGYYSQQHLAPGGPRFSPQSAPRQALSSYLRARGQSNQDVYLHGNPGPIPTHQLQQINPAMMQKQQQQQLRQKLRQQQQQAYMNRMSGGTETAAPIYGQQQQPTSMMQGINYPQMAAQGMAPVYRSYQNVPPQSMMESASNSPMVGSSFNQPYQSPSIGVPTLPPQQGSGYMGQQPPQQTQFSSGARYASVGAAGLRGSDPGMDVDGISGYSQMVPQTGAAAQGGTGYMSAMQQQQQQRLQQMRQQQQQQQQQMLAMQQQQPTPQQMPQQQRTATMMPQQLQQPMSTSHGQPPQYNSYPQY